MLKLLAFVLCIASLVGRSEQAVLTCNLNDAGNPEDFQPDVRICDGFSNNTSNLMMYGSTQTLTVLELLNVNTSGGEVGVCYSTSVLGCYQSGQDVEDCDNFIRDVIDLNGDCNDTYCKVLVCGTNALRAQCTMCEYNGSAVNCSFKENNPPQSLPYNHINDSGYESCANDNTNGVGIFQFRKDDNATFLYDDVGMPNEDGKIYYGLLKSASQMNSIIGLASINKNTGEITGEVTTRTDSQKVVATEAHFMDSPFISISGEYVYFLFREPSQEFASLSQGQDPVINRYYSRIARICKDDQGVSVSSALILTSFLKQRLVCSRTNDNEVLEFNEIQDFEVVNDTIHAIFTTARDDAPLSALCTFNLTAIDQTFETGDFFGADGGTTNDRWRANSGAAITPRPGLSCSNPNTGNTNFQRDYNLMEAPAVQMNQDPIFLEGDRFSQLSLNGTDYYIIASERGCLYSVPIDSDEPIEPCEDPGMPAPIEDLEIHVASNKLLVTANDNVAVSDSNTCIVEPNSTDSSYLSPPGGSYVVRPNARFDIIYDAIFCGSPTIEQGGMKVNDSNDMAYLLIRDESLDLDDTLMHLGILILKETFVEFTNCTDTYTIETYAHYTIGELEKRCDDYDAASAAHSAVNDSCADATMNNKGTFSSAILLNYNQVIDCENCAYSDCKDQC